MTYNLTGQKIGDIEVIKKARKTYEPKSSRWTTYWLCKCLCGKLFETNTTSLTGKKPRETCGCCEWYIHHNAAYVSWMGLKQRCDNPDVKDYKNYGARGIGYDPRWKKFTEFYKDMGDPPDDQITGERLSLDRIDVNGNYTKENCKWSTRSEQQHNKR